MGGAQEVRGCWLCGPGLWCTSLGVIQEAWARGVWEVCGLPTELFAEGRGGGWMGRVVEWANGGTTQQALQVFSTKWPRGALVGHTCSRAAAPLPLPLLTHLEPSLVLCSLLLFTAALLRLQGIDKTANLAIVVTETERQASWSRLEGLILHWACSEASGAAWHLPPPGWKAVPNKTADAGKS